MMTLFAFLFLDAAYASGLQRQALETDRLEWAVRLSRYAISRQIEPVGVTPSGSGQGTIPPGIKVSTSDSQFYGYDGTKLKVLTEAQFRAIVAQEEARSGQLAHARTLVRKQQLSSARALVDQALAGGSADNFAAEVLAEIAMHQGRFTDALLALAPQLGSAKNELVLLMAANAGAMDGQVFPGQQQYCAAIVAKGSGGLANIHEGRNPQQELMATKRVSTFALASWYETHGFDESAKHFYMRGLELEPENAWASYSLGKVFARQRLWALAAQHFEVAASHSSGTLQRFAKRELGKARSRAQNTINIGGG